MPRRLADLLEEKLGTRATPYFNRLGVTQLGPTSVRVYASDPNRFTFIFFNLGPSTVYLFPDPTVATTRAFVVAPNGGSAIATWEEDFELVTAEWWGQAGAAGNNILALEIASAGA